MLQTLFSCRAGFRFPKVLLAFALAALRTLNAQKSEVADAAPFAMPARELMDHAKAEPSSTAGDALILLDQDRWVFAADGRKTETSHIVYRVLTARGVEDWASLERYWEPWHQKRPVVRARVIGEDGSVHELDSATITDAPVRGEQDNTFSDARVVRCPLPAIAPGSIVEQEIVIEETAAEFAAGVVTRVAMSRPVAVRRSILTIEYPEKLPFQYATYLLPDVKTAKVVTSGVVHLSFDAKAMEPAPPVPPMLPFDVPRWPEVIFSTGTSWGAVAREYNRLVERQIERAPVGDLVKQAAAGKKDRNDVISALLRALHTQVRYTGVEFGEAAIVPAKPGDTLSRKYGDCKDKAALLVAMLRAAGIPAYVALLSSGTGRDIDPGQPGMGLFDHAIVYVPAGSGPRAEEFWIDATAEYLTLGAVPSGDQDRLALIVNDATKELRTIPESPSSMNQVTETREFFLPDFGKARVLETTDATGESDSWYRSEFGSADTDQVRKNLTTYMRNNYLSEDSPKIEHEGGSDFSKPFRLRLEITGARRGSVSESDAAVAIPASGLTDRLPAYFFAQDEKPAVPGDKPARPRNEDFMLPTSLVTEWNYRIHLPPGFQAKKIPADKKMAMGPALLTAEYHVEKDIATARLRFDTVKRRYTAAEAAEVKKAVLEFSKQPITLLLFEPVAESHLQAGRVAEAIAGFAAMAKQFPGKALYHVQSSRALLAAGCGEQARREAELATAIEPSGVLAWRNLGFVRIHDLIGREFQRGFDPEGAETAFRKALSLDPKDVLSSRILALSLEYDLSARRYASPDRLKKAVEVLRAMGEDREKEGLNDNLLYDLAYSGQYKELRAELSRLPVSPVNSALGIVASVALDGAASAIAEWDKAGSDAAARSAALQSAAAVLLELRMYPQTADVFTAAARGSQAAAQLLSRANSIRAVHPFDPQKIGSESPRVFVSNFFAALFSTEASNSYLIGMFGKEAIGSDSPDKVNEQVDQVRHVLHAQASAVGVSPRVMSDLVASVVQSTEDRNGDDGYRVRLTVPGAAKTTYYVAAGPAGLRLVGSKDSPEAIGRRVLANVDAGRLAEARQWLDWMREEIPLGGGDDPLKGPAFPRLWTKGAQADAGAIRAAAASLIGMTSASKEALPLLRTAMTAASGEAAKTAAELAYVRASLTAESAENVLAPAQALAARYPDSSQARQLLLSAYIVNEDWKSASDFAGRRLAEDPNDAETSRLLARSLEEQGKFGEAEILYGKLANSVDGTDLDWNQFGWSALLAGDITAEKITQVQRDATAHPNLAPLLHTLAAMYAETGKTAEAREVILSAMKAWGLDEPSSECWYVFGRIAEQLGVRDAALADYERVKRPDQAKIARQVTYSIAQRRIAQLKSGK